MEKQVNCGEEAFDAFDYNDTFPYLMGLILPKSFVCQVSDLKLTIQMVEKRQKERQVEINIRKFTRSTWIITFIKVLCKQT